MLTEGENISLFPRTIDISDEHLLKEEIHQDFFLMDGKLYPWNGERQYVYSPVLTGENGEFKRVLMGSYPLMDEHAAMNVLNAAEEAFHKGRGEWPTMTIEQRLDYLIDFYERLKCKKREIVKPILKSGKINVLAFIGNSKVANILKFYHPKPNRLTEVYGLEAKNPGIILHDADLDFSVKECIRGALTFNGQRCTALKILYVHSALVDSFLERLKTELRQIKVGMPWEKDVVITPLPEDNKTGNHC